MESTQVNWVIDGSEYKEVETLAFADEVGLLEPRLGEVKEAMETERLHTRHTYRVERRKTVGGDKLDGERTEGREHGEDECGEQRMEIIPESKQGENVFDEW